MINRYAVKRTSLIIFHSSALMQVTCRTCLQLCENCQPRVRRLRADIFNAIFTTGAAVTLIITLFLDNTIPGTMKERGLHVWLKAAGSDMDWWENETLHDVSTPDSHHNATPSK